MSTQHVAQLSNCQFETLIDFQIIFCLKLKKEKNNNMKFRSKSALLNSLIPINVILKQSVTFILVTVPSLFSEQLPLFST